MMKIAQYIRPGNVILVGDVPMVVQRTDFHKSGRNSSVVRMRLRSLLGGTSTETVYKTDEKFEVVMLERKSVTYSYFADPMYVFMDEEFNQYEVAADNMGTALDYLEDGMACELVFYEEQAIAVEMPTTVVREILEAENAVRGDTVAGRVLKSAKISSGLEIKVPLFCTAGDKIEIDTRTNEYRSRA